MKRDFYRDKRDGEEFFACSIPAVNNSYYCSLEPYHSGPHKAYFSHKREDEKNLVPGVEFPENTETIDIERFLCEHLKF